MTLIQEIDGLIERTTGMQGDLKGAAGRTLQEINGPNVKMLESE